MHVRAFEFRNKTSKEMLKELEESRAELSQLKVAKATGAAASKLAKIRVVRNNIARLLTVYNQKIRAEARTKYEGKKRSPGPHLRFRQFYASGDDGRKIAQYVPLDLRPKKTRAIRRALTSAQKKLVTVKEKTRKNNFPQRNYALKA
ncbi:unnamed protein product [Amoebophrya sp. A25]|nr:unnamed protein product [Amoebophrya sp. A25]|eukprot:GSA25T00018811001.1